MILYKLISDKTGVIALIVCFACGVIFIWGRSNEYFKQKDFRYINKQNLTNLLIQNYLILLKI